MLRRRVPEHSTLLLGYGRVPLYVRLQERHGILRLRIDGGILTASRGDMLRRDHGCFTPIVYKLIRDHIRGRRFAWGGATLFVLLAASGVLAARDTAHSVDAHAQGRAERARWISQAATYIEALPVMEVPPAALGGFCRGISWVRGGAVLVPGWYGPVAAVRDEMGGGIRPSGPLQDAAGVIVLIATLLGMFFAYDSIAGERERGTLRLLLSMSVPKGRLVVAHAAAAITCVGIPLFLGMLAWLLGGRLQGVPQDVSVLLRAGLAFAASMLLVSLAVWTSVLVSLRSPSASEALLAVALLWGVGALVLPNATATVARLMSPGAQIRPTRGIDIGTVPGQLSTPQGDGLYSRVEGRGFRPEDEFPDSYRAGRWSLEKHGPILAQHRLYRHLSILSPVDAYRETCAVLAGTDLVSQADLMIRAARLQEGVRNWQEAKIQAAPHRSRIFTDQDRALDLAGMPVIPAAGERDLIGRGLLWMSVLVGWNIAAAAAALRTRLAD